MLEFPSRFPDDEFQVLRFIQHHEVRAQQIAERVQCQIRLAGFAETAQPVFLFREFLQPCVGRGNDENSPGMKPLVNRLQKSPGILKPIDQIGGQNEVEAGELRLEIRRVPLDEFDTVRTRSRPNSDNRASW